jgi:LmbE family N-acetylglucosaminyl deacetylase
LGQRPDEVKRPPQLNFCANKEIDLRRRMNFLLLLLLGAAAFLTVPYSFAIAAAAPERPAPPFPARTEADLLVILAHPDDEGALAPLLAREALGAKRVVVNVYITTGANGADRSRGLSGPAFGLARMTELHWALDALGVAMFHSLGREDGVEANGEPAAVLEAWGLEETVGELARFIRLLRPREMITWVPGPPASHAEHAAAGAAALLAWRAAASADRFPDQISGEGLEAWAIPEVRVVGQAEKLGYPRYPAPVIDEAGEAAGSGDPDGASAGAPSRLSLMAVDEVSPGLGVRWSDRAREAMKEQRAVAMANNLGRGGPFDEPLRLVRVLVPPPPDGESPLTLTVTTSAGTQLFFERVAAEIGDPGLASLFPVMIVARKGAEGRLVVRAGNGSDAEIRATVELELPDGWRARHATRRFGLDPGGSVEFAWQLRPPDRFEEDFAPATVTLSDGEGRATTLPLALRVFAPDPGG